MLFFNPPSDRMDTPDDLESIYECDWEPPESENEDDGPPQQTISPQQNVRVSISSQQNVQSSNNIQFNIDRKPEVQKQSKPKLVTPSRSPEKPNIEADSVKIHIAIKG